MDEDSQRETIAFLRGVCTRAGDLTPPMSTHISRIFFAGETVYKLKRAVRTPYLDFSTFERRMAACNAELALNRRTAPDLYLRVRRIARTHSGMAFDADGDLVDAVVEMRRFDQANLFDQMALRGVLTPALVEDLARSLALFHRDAEASQIHGGGAAIRRILDLNEGALKASFLAVEQDVAPICAEMHQTLQRHAALIDARKQRGKVRRCHGDLTLRNIALINGRPTPFDCLEFAEELATIDVLYDIAFVLMDLWHRRCGSLANGLLNRYLDNVDETDGLPLLPLFIAMRAVVRAHVTARMSEDAEGAAREEQMDEARAYLALAKQAMQPAPPRLAGVGGLSGSGKSTIAAALAPLLPPIPGARVLSSDRVRKAMFSAAPTERLPPEAYNPEVSERVYARVRSEAARCLTVGWPVVCDAVFDRAVDRAALAEVARKSGAPFSGFWLEAPLATLSARVAARTDDPSDANVDVLRAQEARFTQRAEIINWTRLDASAPAQETAQRAAALIVR